MTANAAMTEHLGPPLSADRLTALATLVGLERPVEVVDVGASPLVGEDPCYEPLVRAGLARVTAFEPDEEALASLAERGDASVRHLSHAIGDGADATLRRCAEGGFSSLLEPDPAQLAVLTDFPRLAHVVDRSETPTVRLDDVPELEIADLLAIDVQGSETAVLAGGTRVLSGAFAVQVEVGFHRLYEDGPTFADVDGLLRDAGFVPHTFVTTRTWPLAPVTWEDPLQERSRHLVEADLLYVRDLTRLTAVDPAVLRAGVVIACGGYGCFGLGLVCLRELVARGVLDAATEDEFRRLVSDPEVLDDGTGPDPRPGNATGPSTGRTDETGTSDQTDPTSRTDTTGRTDEADTTPTTPDDEGGER